MQVVRWKRWVLLGLLAGAAPLGGCEKQTRDGTELQGRGPAGEASGLPSQPQGGTGGSGSTTGGVNTFPGSQGQEGVPGSPVDTLPAVPPTEQQGGPSGSRTPDTETGTEGQVPGEDATGGTPFRD